MTYSDAKVAVRPGGQYWRCLILPEGGAARPESVPLQRASLVSTQVFSVAAADGEPAVFVQLQGEVLGHLAVRAHQPGAVHVPEAAVDACRAGWTGSGRTRSGTRRVRLTCDVVNRGPKQR